MLQWTGFTTVRSQHECVHAPFRAEVIQHRHVGVHAVDVVRIWRILVLAPLIRRQHAPIEQWILRFGFIVNGIKSDHVLQEFLQLWVLAGIVCRIEQLFENESAETKISLGKIKILISKFRFFFKPKLTDRIVFGVKPFNPTERVASPQFVQQHVIV